jgi:hypothetical protein
MILIIVSRILIGFANNQMMNKKYITLYLPKFRLPSVSKIYLISELIGLIIGPIITLLLCLIKESSIFSIFDYNHFNCIGWYGLFASLFLLLIHFIFFIKPLSSDFVMVKDESNISGSKYYQKSESEISRKQYLKEQNMMYKKTYNSIKKKHRGNKKDNGDDEDLIINVKANDKKDNDNNEDIIKTNNNLEEKLITDDENNKNNKSIDLENDDNNSLDIVGERNIALGEKQQKMINDIEKALEKKNEECNFIDMNQIPKLINSIIDKEKKSFGYINKNLLLLFILFFICSMIKSNIIFNYIYFIQEKMEENETSFFCLLIILLGCFQLIKIFFIYPFYKVNYKFRFFMLMSLSGLTLCSALLLVLELLYENDFKCNCIYVIINISIVLGCNIIDISCSCYLSFILAPEWKIFGKNVGYWSNYMIKVGKIVGGIICMFLCDKDYVNNWVLFGVSTTFFIFFLILILFTRIIRIKGITRVLRKTACEINLDN